MGISVLPIYVNFEFIFLSHESVARKYTDIEEDKCSVAAQKNSLSLSLRVK
jgi:hypothetical protein